MNNFDYKGLDATLLATVIAVYEENSVTKAADRLNISQSTLSHRLDRMRDILNDKLFVRSGRGIEPTQSLQTRMPIILKATETMRSLFEKPNFNPADISGSFTIAATDYERSLFLYETCRNILAQTNDLALNFVWDRYDNTKALRRNQFDLAIGPYIGQKATNEIRSITLFNDQFLCFYDPEQSQPIKDLDDYLARQHLSIIFSQNDESFIDAALRRIGKNRSIMLRVPSISEVPSLLKGTNLIVTLPTRVRNNIMRNFQSSTVPLTIPTITYGMFWHAKNDASAKHQWLRNQILETAKSQLVNTKPISK